MNLHSQRRIVGRRVAQLRRALRLTQAKLAEKVGIQPETISRLETGASMPSLDRVAAVAAALDVELHDLFRTREGTAKGRAVEKLHEFGMRLTVPEIDMVIDLGAVAVKHVRLVGTNGAEGRR
jgi:transcriptional regulator with XRE-family HTH domain